MRAMLFEGVGRPLRLEERPLPIPATGEVLIRVSACGVCRTDLHVVEGDLKFPKLPLILGHEIVGRVESLGAGIEGLVVGQRIGVPWLGGSCTRCGFCRRGEENLCDEARFTGYQVDGGYADYTVADHRYCFPLPDNYDDLHAAPLLCAGLIGYRSYRMAGVAQRLGLYGFGAAAHIIAQVAVQQGREVYAFSRPDDREVQAFARTLGVHWAGGSDQASPVELDAAIIFAPVGALVPAALKAVRKGGRVVCAGIHMSDIPSFAYELLWGERTICSVANLTRQDGIEFMRVAGETSITTSVQPFPLEQANEALEALRLGKVQGAAVLQME